MIVHNHQVAVLELLGEGTFAKVFKATLKQEKPPAPVSVTVTIAKWHEMISGRCGQTNFINH